MTKEEKCLLAIEKGYTYNPETGIIYGVYGKEIKCKSSIGYILIMIYNNKKKYNLYGHQFAYYSIHNKVVDCIDHINGVKHDNRIYNLRSITNQKNLFNTNAKGYYYNNRDKVYISRIMLNSKSIHIGSFKIEEEAQQAYLEAKKTYHII